MRIKNIKIHSYTEHSRDRQVDQYYANLKSQQQKTVCLDENHFNQNKLFFIFTLILFYENN